MLLLSHNLSDTLKKYLAEIQSTRTAILTTPLSPKIETRVRWETMLNKIYYSLTIEENPLSRKEITRLLSSWDIKEELTPNQVDAINYRRALDYIKQNWTVNPKPVSTENIKTIYDIAIKPTSTVPLSASNLKEIKALLSYIQTGKQSPVIETAIVCVSLLTMPILKGSFRLASLSSTLFMYKYGYDIRGLLSWEEYMSRDPIALKRAVEAATRSKNLTVWIEYFAACVSLSAKKALSDVLSNKFKTDLPNTFWRLNKRQKEVLSRLDIPGEKISNRNLQEMFGVSQITASRDLAQLTKLGLIHPQGKGRSTYYIRI